jgi:YidC/Oxa1 family membrane protein insertase
MGFFFTVFYQPFYNLLVWLYVVMPVASIGIPIIVTTLLIKGALFPLTFRSLKSQKEMQEIQPMIKEIREKYKDDKEKQAQELMAVYKNHNVNPLASCLPLLIQLPIFLALFRVLQEGLGEVKGDILYTFVQNPETINTMFLGIDLAQVSVPLAILAAIAQYFQAKQTIARRPAKEIRNKEGAKDEDMMAQMNKMMIYFMPIITLTIGVTSLQGGVMLYWLATTFLTIILYKIFLKKPKEEVVTV